MVEAVDKDVLTWSDIEDLVHDLLGQVDPTDYDSLLAITRGGMVPACLLSEISNMRDILVAAVMFYTEDRQTLDKPVFLQFPPDPYLSEKRILIVDDVWDSGRTVMAVRQRIEAAGGHPETAVLHYKPQQSLFDAVPEFYAAATDEWIVYPWDPERQRRTP